MKLFLLSFFYVCFVSCAGTGERVGASESRDQSESKEMEQNSGFVSFQNLVANPEKTTGSTLTTGSASKMEEDTSKKTYPREHFEKNSTSENSKITQTSATKFQEYEILVITEDPIGAYELTLFYSPKEATLEKLVGGNSVYFKAVPWINQNDILPGKLTLSSFHGSSEGPSGDVSLGRVVFRWPQTVMLEGRLNTLVSPDQKQISGKLVLRAINEKDPLKREQQTLTTDASKNMTSTEVFLFTSFPLGGYVLVLEYDPNFLHIQEIQGGSSPYFASPPFASTQTYRSGRTKISGFYGGFPGPIGKISICWIFFKTLREGRTSLRVENLELSDSEGNLQEGSSQLVPEVIEAK